MIRTLALVFVFLLPSCSSESNAPDPLPGTSARPVDLAGSWGVTRAMSADPEVAASLPQRVVMSSTAITEFVIDGSTRSASVFGENTVTGGGVFFLGIMPTAAGDRAVQISLVVSAESDDVLVGQVVFPASPTPPGDGIAAVLLQR